MAIFLIATGPALALLAKLTGWHSDRKQASLSPKVEVGPFPWSGITLAYNRTELEGFKVRNRGDVSKLQGPGRRHRQPPIV
jgi:hypothetical protein